MIYSVGEQYNKSVLLWEETVELNPQDYLKQMLVQDRCFSKAVGDSTAISACIDASFAK